MAEILSISQKKKKKYKRHERSKNGIIVSQTSKEIPFSQISETDESPYSRRNKTIAFYILQRANCSFQWHRAIPLLTTRSNKLRKKKRGMRNRVELAEIEGKVKWSLAEFRRERGRESQSVAIIYVYLRVSYSTPSRDRIVSVGVWLCTHPDTRGCVRVHNNYPNNHGNAV